MATMRGCDHVLLQGSLQMYKKISHNLCNLFFSLMNCFERVLIIKFYTLMPEKRKNWKKICRLYPVNTNIRHIIKYMLFLCFYAG